MSFRYCAHKLDHSSQESGCFIHSGDFIALSPVFATVPELFDWMDAHGWIADTNDSVWGVRKSSAEQKAS